MSERVLVVDDDRGAADGLARLITDLGFEAKAVYGGVEAIEQAAGFAPDMVLLDIGMPDQDGYETVARIRKQPGFTHVILVAVTGWTREEDKQRAYQSGFDLHVAKPMDEEKLRQLLMILDPSPPLDGSGGPPTG